MNFRKFQLAVLAATLGGAMGLASAQGTVPGAGGSTAVPATSGSTDLSSSAGMSSNTAISGNSGSAFVINPNALRPNSGLNGTDSRLLRRHNSLR